jgi:predicted MPP superfamily phosphohydrolase
MGKSMRFTFVKNRSLLYYILSGILLLSILYVILAYHVPAVKMRIFIFAIWMFGEIYLWITLLNSFKNTWKKKISFIILVVCYWLPACVIVITMGILGVKGMHQLNKTLYLTVVGFCIIQYLIKFLIFTFILVYDLIALFAKKIFNVKRGKRILLRFSAGFYVVALILMIYGTFWEADDFQIREMEIDASKGKDVLFREFKLVLISDLHLASWRNPIAIEKAVQLVNAQLPDFVFITGDLVQFSSEEVIEYIPILSQLKSRYGIFSVLGNHDYGRYARFKTDVERKMDIQKLINYQTSLGWRVLNNESVKLYSDSAQMGITIAGVEFYSPKKMFFSEGDLVRTFQNVDSNDYIILLSHDPQAWDDVISNNYPASLTLSGHTHGMQLGYYSNEFKFSPASLLYKQWGGLYEKKDKFLYVNVGLGSVGFPARVGMKPEITVINIKLNLLNHTL